MTNIIDIEVQTPYLRPNYNYIVDCMLEEGAAVIIHKKEESAFLGKNITRRGYAYGMTNVVENQWMILIKGKAKPPVRGMQVDLDNIPEYYQKKIDLLAKKKEVLINNRGQAIYLIGLYRKANPTDKRKITFKKQDDGYLMWGTDELIDPTKKLKKQEKA